MPLTLTRSILGILVPGVVASAPWLLLLLKQPQIQTLYKSLELPFSVLLLVTSVVAGALCDGIGSHIEASLDAERESAYDIKKNWYAYLAKTPQSEPVGFRYISRLATTLNFELSMLTAMPMFLLGCSVWWGSSDAVPVASCLILIVASVGYFRWQVRCTHEVLCETRQQLNALVP
jgi:hypothetical protein